ncbi:MAG: DUF5103 domain-containing protein, partial [Siphonobacter sp.]
FRRLHYILLVDGSYGSYPVLNPREDLKIVIRQNFRWDRVIKGLKPSMVRQTDHTLEYRSFDNENIFPGGNEFRTFDIRNRQTKGYGVARMDHQPTFSAVFLSIDSPVKGQNYVQQNDMDGQFSVGSTDDLGLPDYFPVTFTLRMPEQMDNRVPYVLGSFDFYDLTNPMHYEPTAQAYQMTVLLKQGVYNYCYGLAGPNDKRADDVAMEGSFSFTKNTYEIFVYHRPLGERADQLVGYQVINN